MSEIQPLELQYDYHGVEDTKRAQCIRYFLLGWSPQAIAAETGLGVSTIYRYRAHLVRYGSLRAPYRRKRGRPCLLSQADEDALFEKLLQEGWLYLNELVFWLDIERGVHVSESTVCRVIKRRRWSRKRMRWISRNRSQEMREAYQAELRQFDADDMVFLDESIFNEKTGWRYRCYSPIGHESRGFRNMHRGKTWAAIGAYTIRGLIAYGIRQGYYSREHLIEWLRDVLLPSLARDSPRPRVIVLDNCSTHVSEDVIRLLEEAGHLVRFTPPYSPDYNPIEMVWSVLKAWIRRNHVYTRHLCSNFGEFLDFAITRSQCDRFGLEHFANAAHGIYISDQRYDELRVQLRGFENGRVGYQENLVLEDDVLVYDDIDERVVDNGEPFQEDEEDEE